MSEHDRRLAELVTDAADAVEPAYRLDAIRAAAGGGSRPSWRHALAAGVAVAAVVAAVAVVGSQVPSGPPEPAGPGPKPPASPSTSPPQTSPPAASTTVAVYYVGDTGSGPRLFREFRRLPGANALVAAVGAAVGTAPDGTELAPLDPDYRSAWPAGTTADARFDGLGADGELTIDLAGPGVSRDRPAGMGADEARMAVEQLVWTAQAAVGVRAPVRILLGDGITDQVLGVPVPEPLTTGPALDVLNRVNLTTPEQGATVDGDTLEVTGVANSVEATVGWELLREGEPVRTGHATAEGWMGERLFPFSTTIDVSGLSPGAYTLVASTSDPSGGLEGDGPQADDKDLTLR